MKIGELLKLTKTKKISDIAKESLDIGEKPTREALKKAGCFSISGKSGWFFEGDKNVLEQSIYDFSPPKKINRTTGKATANVSTKEPKKELTLEPSNLPAKEEMNLAETQTAVTEEPTNVRTKEPMNVSTKETKNVSTNEPKTIIRKRSSFDIDVELMKELKIKAVLNDKNVYEMVETAIRNYLKDL